MTSRFGGHLFQVLLQSRFPSRSSPSFIKNFIRCVSAQHAYRTPSQSKPSKKPSGKSPRRPPSSHSKPKKNVNLLDEIAGKKKSNVVYSNESHTEKQLMDLEHFILKKKSQEAWDCFQKLLYSEDKVLTFHTYNHLIAMLDMLKAEFVSKSKEELNTPLRVEFATRVKTLVSTIKAGGSPVSLPGYHSILRAFACAKLEDDMISILEELRNMPSNSGLKPEAETFNIFIDFYAKNGRMDMAHQYYNMLVGGLAGVKPKNRTHFMMITSFISLKDYASAENHWSELLSEPNLDMISLGPELHMVMVKLWLDKEKQGEQPGRALEHIARLKSLVTDENRVEATNIVANCLESFIESQVSQDGAVHVYETLMEKNAEFLTPNTCRMIMNEMLTLDKIEDAKLLLGGFADILTGKVSSSREFRAIYTELAELLLKKAVDMGDTELAQEIYFSMKRFNLKHTPLALEYMIELFVKKDELDLASETFMNFRANNQWSDIPPRVYNVFLAGLASHYRMNEFCMIFNKLVELKQASNSTFIIALEAFLNVKDAARAFDACEKMIENNYQPSLNTLLTLFELTVFSKMYSSSARVMGWMRKLNIENDTELARMMADRVIPLSQVIEQGLQGEKSMTEDKMNVLALFNTYVVNNMVLPDSVYVAVLRHYHFQTRDMINVAKVWSVICQREYPDKTRIPPSVIMTNAFLSAAADLCGYKAGKTVLKLVEAESLEMSEQGYHSLLALCSKYGWGDDMIKTLVEMDSKGMPITAQLYGKLDELLSRNNHQKARRQVSRFMENNYPEILGSWLEIQDAKEEQDKIILQ